MKKNKTIIPLLTVLTSTNFIPTIFQNHTEIINKIKQIKEDHDGELKLEDIASNSLFYSYLVNHPFKAALAKSASDVSTNNTEIDEAYINEVGAPIVNNDKTALYIGTNVFVNNTDTQQTYNTSNWAKQVTDSNTTTTTWGINVKLSVGFKVPKLNVEAQFSFQRSTSKTHSETITITSPNQPVVVPPHKTYQAEVFLNAQQVKIDVNLNLKMSGSINGRINFKDGSSEYYSTNFAEAVKTWGLFSDLPFGLSTENNKVVFKGLGNTISSEHGTNFTVVTREVK